MNFVLLRGLTQRKSIRLYLFLLTKEKLGASPWKYLRRLTEKDIKQNG